MKKHKTTIQYLMGGKWSTKMTADEFIKRTSNSLLNMEAVLITEVMTREQAIEFINNKNKQQYD